MEIRVETETKVTLDEDMTSSQIFAVLDAMFGHLNGDDTREYGRVCRYPVSIRMAYNNAKSR